jgi:inhibitor of KinA sporulation pathway (predicted exonuclease)
MTDRNYLVIDLEATCCDAGTVPRQQMEIIEIGAVLVDGRTFEPLREFQTFIRPVRHPRLTAFCTELTTITQADVDGAPAWWQAIERFDAFVGDAHPLFSSWGNYDRNQFRQDAAYHKRWPRLSKDHLNVKQAFSDTLGTTKRFGMAGALRKLGLRLDGTHHRGIDDARNIARILPYAIGARPMPAR